MRDRDGGGTKHERWALLRFEIVGRLLASPPAHGRACDELRRLGESSWRHPFTGAPIRFGRSTIERWYYAARGAADPVAVLRKRIRCDAGAQPSLSLALREVLRAQYQAHPRWSCRLHYDNLAVLVAQDPALGRMPSYPSVFRYMKRSGLLLSLALFHRPHLTLFTARESRLGHSHREGGARASPPGTALAIAGSPLRVPPASAAPGSFPFRSRILTMKAVPGTQGGGMARATTRSRKLFLGRLHDEYHLEEHVSRDVVQSQQEICPQPQSSPSRTQPMGSAHPSSCSGQSPCESQPSPGPLQANPTASSQTVTSSAQWPPGQSASVRHEAGTHIVGWSHQSFGAAQRQASSAPQSPSVVQTRRHSQIGSIGVGTAMQRSPAPHSPQLPSPYGHVGAGSHVPGAVR